MAAVTVRQHEHEPLPVLRRRPLVAGIVLFLIGVALTVVVATSSVLQPLDDRFVDLMVSLRSTPAVDVGQVLNVAFGTAVLLPLRIAITVVLAVRRHWAPLGAWLATPVAGVEVWRDHRRKQRLSRRRRGPRSTAAS